MKFPCNICVSIFDTFYSIFSRKRKSCRQVLEIEALENKNGNKKRLSSIKEYKGKLFSEVSQFLTRLINDIKKGIKNNQNKNKELESFLQFNLSDYKRYLCEVTLDPLVKEEYIKETEECYKRYFTMLTEHNVCEVSPAAITGHYHYSIFLFEVKNTKNEAIKYLKDQRLSYITQLDTMFKNFIESYEILDTITTTLTNYKEVDL